MADKKKELNIYQRLKAVMDKVSYVQKDLDVTVSKTQSYKGLSHDKVVAAVRGALLEVGIVIIPTIKEHRTEWFSGTKYNKYEKKREEYHVLKTEVCVLLKFVNIDNPEDYIETESWGYGLDTQDKGFGKAYSYGFKYGIQKILLLETGDDPERDSIDHQPAVKDSILDSKTREDAAVQWVEQAQDQMSDCSSIEELDAWMDCLKNGKHMNKLVNNYPELGAKLMTTEAMVRSQLSEHS